MKNRPSGRVSHSTNILLKENSEVQDKGEIVRITAVLKNNGLHIPATRLEGGGASF